MSSMMRYLLSNNIRIVSLFSITFREILYLIQTGILRMKVVLLPNCKHSRRQLNSPGQTGECHSPVTWTRGDLFNTCAIQGNYGLCEISLLMPFILFYLIHSLATFFFFFFFAKKIQNAPTQSIPQKKILADSDIIFEKHEEFKKLIFLQRSAP